MTGDRLGGALSGCALLATAGLLAFAPPNALMVLLVAAVGGVILLVPALGLALTVGSVPFSGLWALPLGAGSLTWTPLVLGLTAVAWLAHGAGHGWLSAMRRASRQPVLWALAAYVGALLAAAWHAPHLPAALFEVARWLEWGLACLITADLGRRRSVRHLVLVTLLVCSAATAAVAVASPPTSAAAVPFLAAGTPYARAYGTFGQPNPFAAYMNMIWPLGVGLLVLPMLGRDQVPEPVGRSGDGRRPMGRRPSGLAVLALWAATGLGAAAICLVGVVRSWSRGGWLGAAVAAAVMAALVAARAFRRPYSGPQLGALWLALLLVLLALSSGPVTRLPAAVVERVASISTSPGLDAVADAEVHDANFATLERLAHWQAALAMWSQQPWLGQGPGHFELAYARFRLGRWPDPLGHAHNYYLHALAESGLVGLASFLAFLGSAWWVAARAAWQRRFPLPAALGLGVAGVFSAVAVHSLVDNVFVHEMTITLGVLAGLVLATAEA